MLIPILILHVAPGIVTVKARVLFALQQTGSRIGDWLAAENALYESSSDGPRVRAVYRPGSLTIA